MANPVVERQLAYIVDPMCSWCWGFQPVIRRLVEIADGRAILRIIVGGLRAYNTEPTDDTAKATIAEHWRHVGERTGQPFDFGFFERTDFIYDTEPACRAIVTTRGLDRAKAHDMLDALHRAFYAENRDITSVDTLGEIAAEIGFEREKFVRELDSDAVRHATRNDFVMARQIGVTGFPTVLAGEKGAVFRVLTKGYQDFDALEGPLSHWLDNEPEGEVRQPANGASSAEV